MNVRTKKILKYLDYGITVALFVVLIVDAAGYVTGFQMITVDSSSPSSMTPTMNYGDVALAIPYSFSSLPNESIISFHRPIGDPAIVVHRVVGKLVCSNGAICYATKGDNNVTNPTIDPWNVTSNLYIGRVVLIVPLLGYLSPALWGFQGALAFLPIVFVIFLLMFVSSVAEGKKQKQEVKA